jgi:hypothetical protein
VTETRQFIAIVPLANFGSKVDLIRLDNTSCLRRIDDGELRKLKERVSVYRPNLENALFNVTYVIEKKLASAKAFRLWNEGSPNVRNIILALRLLNPDAVGTPTSFLLSNDNASFSVNNTSPFPVLAEKEYFLKGEEIACFELLWKKLKQVEKDKPYLTFPLFQFDRAVGAIIYDADSLDSLVDCLTGLESLVFYKEGRTIEPAGRVIRIVIGMLLANNQSERTRIKETIAKAYEMRNAKVHGNVEKLEAYDEEDVNETYREVEDYLRHSLKKLVEE